MPSCVAVSNSSWLRDRGLGPLIDAHDVVVRFNGARTAGAERDLGRRTTIWATSPPLYETSLRPARSLLFVPAHLVAPPEAAKLERIPPDVEAELRALTQLGRNIFPTTGLAAVYFLLRDYPQITLAGWHQYPDCAVSLASWWSYYDPTGLDVSKRHTYHDRAAEIAYVRHLVRQGRLRHLDPVEAGPRMEVPQP